MSLGRRPWLLWLPVVTCAAVAGAPLLLAGLVGSGANHVGRQGFMLTGWRLALFTAALATLIAWARAMGGSGAGIQ
jgi:hypothetical protein